MRTFPIILTTVLKNKYQRNKYFKKSLKYLGNLNPKDGLTGTGKFRLPDIRWKLGWTDSPVTEYPVEPYTASRLMDSQTKPQQRRITVLIISLQASKQL